ncbi:MAG: hypothetical protein R3E89_16260 [Thiolinea sp.]
MAILGGPLTASADENASASKPLTETQREQLNDDFIGPWLVTLSNELSETLTLYSFLPGGVLHQSENPMVDPMLGSLVFSNAHGAWEQNEDGSFSIHYFKLVYQADASYWGQEETTGRLRLNEKGQLTGVINYDGGQQQMKFSGERIQAKPDKK